MWYDGYMDTTNVNLTIEQKYGVKYTGILARMLQQEDSVLSPYATLLPHCVGKSVNIDYRDTSQMQRITSAYQEVGTPLRDSYGSRQMMPVPMYTAHEFTCDADLYSNNLKQSVPGIVTEIKSEALRKLDEVILGIALDTDGVYRKITTSTAPESPYAEVLAGGILGTNYVGQNGKTLVDLPTDRILEHTFVESGTSAASNMTIGKFRRAIAMLKKSKAYVPGRTTPVCAMSSSQLYALMQQFEVNHPGWGIIDMKEGRMFKLFGCEIVETELLPYVTGTTDVRICPMWIKEHVYYGKWKDTQVRVEGPANKRVNYGQVVAQLSYGAMRKYESSVVEIQCQE